MKQQFIVGYLRAAGGQRNQAGFFCIISIRVDYYRMFTISEILNNQIKIFFSFL